MVFDVWLDEHSRCYVWLVWGWDRTPSNRLGDVGNMPFTTIWKSAPVRFHCWCIHLCIYKASPLPAYPCSSKKRTGWFGSPSWLFFSSLSVGGWVGCVGWWSSLGRETSMWERYTCSISRASWNLFWKFDFKHFSQDFRVSCQLVHFKFGSLTLMSFFLQWRCDSCRLQLHLWFTLIVRCQLGSFADTSFWYLEMYTCRAAA